jgi:hypothetical protein
MRRLDGAQRIVLQAIADAQRETSEFIEASQIAVTTGISLADTSDWLLTLEQDEYVNLTRTVAGFGASITSKGRLALSLSRPFGPPTPPRPATQANSLDAQPAVIVEPPDDSDAVMRQRARERIEILLRRLKPEVKRELAETLHGDRDPPIDDETDLLSLLAFKLLEPRLFSTIAGLASTFERLCEKGELDQADTVFALAQEATPRMIDHDLAERRWNERTAQRSAFYFVPVDNSTILEVLTARADGKRMSFKAPRKQETPHEIEGVALLAHTRKPPIEGPAKPEAAARSILVDVFGGDDDLDPKLRDRTLLELVDRLAGELTR